MYLLEVRMLNVEQIESLEGQYSALFTLAMVLRRNKIESWSTYMAQAQTIRNQIDEQSYEYLIAA